MPNRFLASAAGKKITGKAIDEHDKIRKDKNYIILVWIGGAEG